MLANGDQFNSMSLNLLEESLKYQQLILVVFQRRAFHLNDPKHPILIPSIHICFVVLGVFQPLAKVYLLIRVIILVGGTYFLFVHYFKNQR